MHDFPSTQEILGELIALKPHDISGQREVVQYIRNLVQTWSLGDIELIPFPNEPKYYPSQTKPEENDIPLNIVITKGQGADEVILNHGHYDTVRDTNYKKNGSTRDPNQLTIDSGEGDKWFGKGALDMLGPVAANLHSLRDMEVWDHRTMKYVLVNCEEDHSQGTHALLHESCSALNNVSGIISNEIGVGTTMDEPQALHIGRQGRIGLELEIRGPTLHSGRVRREMYNLLTAERDGKVKMHLKSIKFPEHPDDPDNIMPESLCVPGQWKSNEPEGLTVASRGAIKLNVGYSNPQLTPEEIQSILYQEFKSVLGDTDFKLTLEERRGLPPTKPYLDSVHNPFVQKGLAFTEQIHGERRAPKSGRSTADEPILVHALHKPCLILPPEGADEHSYGECVRPSSLRNIELFGHKIASHNGMLTE